MKNLIRSCCVLLLGLGMQFTPKAQTPILNSFPSAAATIYLDFDGHTVSGTSWNFMGSFVCGGSGLNPSQINEVFDRVAEDYRPFNINVTTDSTVFLAAPIGKRMRVVLTVSSSWYGTAGGVAFVGSFLWGDDTPCFVFTALHGYNVKNIAEATAHEAGHTLGLYHQSKYDAVCNKVTDYDPGVGSGEIGWAPIMGVGYYRNFTLWNNGPNTFGCSNMQSDLDIITSSANGFGYRNDDHGNSFATATIPVFSSHQFDVIGVVEKNTDQDLFQFIMPSEGRFQLDAVPYNVGSGNSGSDLDMQVTLFDQTQSVLSVYNPGTLLNSVADTTLAAGTYYIKVEGKGNLYASSYASLGSYSLQAKIDGGGTILPVRKLELRGSQSGDNHQLNWTIDADEEVSSQVVEVSTDGRRFTSLSAPGKTDRSYFYRPDHVTGAVQYRVQVVFATGLRAYSNVITIRENDGGLKPKLVSNLITTNTVYVSSPGNFTYTLVDLNGKQVARGQLTNGLNHIDVNGMIVGMYIIRFAGNNQQWTDKLVRQ